MTRTDWILGAALAALTSAGIGGCDVSVVAPEAGTYYGSSFALGNGTARSFVTIDAAGEPSEVGLALSEQAMNGLPPAGEGGGHSHDHSLDIPMPPQASSTPFNHIGLDWNPSGHGPGPYMVPHFDVHFYMITRSQRTAMTGIGEDSIRMAAEPEARYLPAGFVATHEGVPEMGMHWVDPMSPELNGAPFTETMIWGSYNARVVFVEPMITRAFLVGRPDMTKSLKTPIAYQQPGLFQPTTYNVRFDTATKEYVISLSGMTKR